MTTSPRILSLPPRPPQTRPRDHRPLPPHPRRAVSARTATLGPAVEQVIAYWLEDPDRTRLSNTAIAADLGVSARTVARARKRHSLCHLPMTALCHVTRQPTHSARRLRSRPLSDGAERLYRDVCRRRRRTVEAGPEELARRYGISTRTVYRVLERVRNGEPPASIHAIDAPQPGEPPPPSAEQQLAIARAQIKQLRRRVEALRHRQAVVQHGTLQDLVWWLASEQNELDEIREAGVELPQRHRTTLDEVLETRRLEVEAYWSARAREECARAEDTYVAEWIDRQLTHNPCPGRWLARRLSDPSEDTP